MIVFSISTAVPWLTGPQWCSEDVNQQKYFFVKKSEKIESIWLSHVLSKIGQYFRKQSNKKRFPRLLLLDKRIFFQIDSYDSWHWKLILNVKFRHGLTTHVKVSEIQINIMFCILQKYYSCWLTSTIFHYWGPSNPHAYVNHETVIDKVRDRKHK